MNATPILLLVRPERQSKQLLSECEAAFGSSVSAVISPIIRIVPVHTERDLSHFRNFIVTSANAVHHAGNLAGKRLYCVGVRTQIAASNAGGKVIWAETDSKSLIDRMLAEKPDGPIIHLRGRHVVDDLEERLNFAGIETFSEIIYDQVAQPVGVALHQAICGDMRAVLPLYSPRSAHLLGQGVEGLGEGLHVIAISDAVARIWKQQTGGTCEVCNAPDAQEMIGRIVANLRT